MQLEVFTISNNFADAKSIATHPCTTTHKNVPVEKRPDLGLTDGLVRLSIGLEDPDDIIADVLSALDAI